MVSACGCLSGCTWRPNFRWSGSDEDLAAWTPQVLTIFSDNEEYMRSLARTLGGSAAPRGVGVDRHVQLVEIGPAGIEKSCYVRVDALNGPRKERSAVGINGFMSLWPMYQQSI